MGYPAIRAEGLVKTFGKRVRALDGVSLEVQSGTVFGLLGPNGAGKTTLVNVLATLLRPDSGRAEVVGIDVVRHPAAVRRSIGLAGQFAAVDENLTGAENLRLVGRLNHLPGSVLRRRAIDLLERFGLAEAAGRTVKTYSGGMRRRLDLAAALVGDPPVLFLDEPTTGLDPRSRIDLWKEIERLVREGTTLLLTTQYLEEADRLAGRISVVDHGRVIAEGTSQELKARLGGAVVEVRLADAEQARHAAATLSGTDGGEPALQDDLVRVPSRDGTATLTEVVRRLDAAGVRARSLQLREPSLDDVFLALTGHAAEGADMESGAPDAGGEGDVVSGEPPRETAGGPAMSATARPVPPRPLAPQAPGLLERLVWAVGDTLAMAGRNLRRLLRQPEQVMFNLVSPIMFVLLFRYVFGGAIAGLQGLNYVDYLIPGIAVQTVLFSAGVTGFALADDMQKGFVNRLRSLPMARSAVFGGRVVSDTVNSAFGLAILLATGFAVGFRPANVPGLVLASLLLLLFALAVSLGYALVGLTVRSPEAVNAATFPIIFPLTFASSAFVPVMTMPGWLQGFATHQPVSVVINAARSLILGDTATPQQRALLLGNAGTGPLVVQSLAWTLGIGLVFGVLCTLKYRSLNR